MYPVIRIGPAAIQSSVLALLIAFWVGITLAEGDWKRREPGARGNDAWNIIALFVAVTVVAGRLIYVARNVNLYASDPLQILSPAPNTISLDIGAVMGVIAVAAFVQRRRVPLLPLLDALALGALVAVAIVALGQFLSGDAYGTPTDLPWAVWLWGEWRHPVQLYDAVAAFAGAIALVRMRSLLQSGRAGWAALFAAAWYSAVRVLIDAFRGDASVILGGYRSTQVLALLVLLIALWLMERMAAADERRAVESHEIVGE